MLAILAAALAAPVIASTLHEGRYVVLDRACGQASERETVISSGHSVAPVGMTCRVISRTSTGRYYPIINQLCRDRNGSEHRIDLHIHDRESISLVWRVSGKRTRFRFCPGSVDYRSYSRSRSAVAAWIARRNRRVLK